jgi:hypothetical protein
METSRSEDSTNSFSVSTASSNKRRAYRTSHAHIYWVTREPESFEWFKGAMNEVAEMDKKVKGVSTLYMCAAPLCIVGVLMMVTLCFATRASLSFITI